MATTKKTQVKRVGPIRVRVTTTTTVKKVRRRG